MLPCIQWLFDFWIFFLMQIVPLDLAISHYAAYLRWLISAAR
jgi:hypothetical protein